MPVPCTTPFSSDFLGWVSLDVETSSHGDLFPSIKSKYVPSSHSTGSIGQVAVRQFQRD